MNLLSLTAALVPAGLTAVGSAAGRTVEGFAATLADVLTPGGPDAAAPTAAGNVVAGNTTSTGGTTDAERLAELREELVEMARSILAPLGSGAERLTLEIDGTGGTWASGDATLAPAAESLLSQSPSWRALTDELRTLRADRGDALDRGQPVALALARPAET